MSLVSHVMTASHLKAIQPTFENGIPCHITDPEQVNKLLELVNKYARPFDPRLPELDHAFLRLNVNIRHKRNGDIWGMSGAAQSQRSISNEITQVIEQLKTTNPEHMYSEQTLVAWVLNEWDRFSVVFELNLIMESS